jgi:putative transposase
MARLARVVVPEAPHHITQRGNRRERVFFEDSDYRLYLDLIGAAAKRSGAAIVSYCLMPNHVDFLIIPSHADGLRQTVAEAHRRIAGQLRTVVVDDARRLASFGAPAASPRSSWRTEARA